MVDDDALSWASYIGTEAGLPDSASAVCGDTFAQTACIGLEAFLPESASAVGGAAFSQAPSYASRVTETVVDDSDQKPATIHPQEAAHACRLVCPITQEPPQDADQGLQHDAEPADDHLFDQKIKLMTITRSPKEYAEALHEGHELEAVVQLNDRAGFSCRYEDTHIFVHPRQFVRVLAKVTRMKNLRQYHVIVSEMYEHLVKAALKRLRSRLDVRPKASAHLMTLKQFPYSDVLDPHGDGDDLLIVHNTFLEISEKRERNSCTKSSPSASVNPRDVPASSCS